MNIDINLLDDIIKKVLSERKLQLTDRSQKKLCMYIAIAIQRSRNNKTVVYPSSLTSKIENTFEYSVAKEIIERDNGTIRVSSNNGTKFSIRYYK